MNNVTMRSDDLRRRVAANREAHRALYEKAMGKYREEAIRQLNGHLDALMAGQLPDMRLYLPLPEDHTRDYDIVLDMLTDHVGDTVVISQANYRAYVKDDWEWKRHFVGTVSNYVTGIEDA
jgi:hypothetical protein